MKMFHPILIASLFYCVLHSNAQIEVQTNFTIADDTTVTRTTTPTTTTEAPKPKDLPKPEGGKQPLLDWLVHDTDDRLVEYEGYDGWYNNPTNPQLGAVDSQLVRLLPPAYADGVYQPSGPNRPNPITISEKLMKGSMGERSNTGKTAFLVFFGQQVVEELLDVQRPGCPPEYFNIPVPEGHEYRQDPEHTQMPLLRSRYDVNTGQSPNSPRQQINEITPWFDGGLMYGISKGWADTLREFKGGRLASSDGGKYPAVNTIRLPMANPPPPRDHVLKPVSRFFRLGNPRGNENPFLLTFGIFWFRWHNRVAEALQRLHPSWSDERLFNEARKWVIATHQHIVIDTWLPEWLGESLEPYKQYDASIDPGIAHEFQSAAMRFGHTLVTSGGYRRSGMGAIGGCQVYNTTKITGFPGHRAVRTCNSYWNPQEAVREHDIDALILGLSSQSAEREDNVIVEDLRGRVFGPLEFSRRDLMAINIQRARDHGLPDYQTARRLLGLKTFKDFKDMALYCSNVNRLNPDLFNKVLPELYDNKMDEIDIWAGGILETELNRPGELFRTIIKDQMRRIRDGDRFWFENNRTCNNRSLFTDKQVERLKLLTIYDLILSVTNINRGDIQNNPFLLPSASNNGLDEKCRNELKMERGSCTINGTLEDCYYLPPLHGLPLITNCTKAKKFDYFSGSEASYALSFTAVGVFIVGCICLLIWLAQRRQRTVMISKKPKIEEKRKTVDENALSAMEWMGQKEGMRDVILRFRQQPKMITVHSLNGQALRSIDLKYVETVELQVSASGKRDTILIRVAREYDLVLAFSNSEEREHLIRSLEDYLGSVGVGRQRREMNLNHMLSDAITKHDRQKQLEMFFRVVFAQAFHIDHDKNELLHLDATQARDIINTELTIYEFADALSMRPDATFMQQMFALVDTDNNGYISFREFLDMIIIFAKGTPEEKAKLMFDMYDFDHSGKLTHEQFTVMIKSMLELSNHTLSSEKLNHLVTTMFKAAGLSGKEDLAFTDFTRLLADYNDQLGYAQLNFDVAGFQPIIPAPPQAGASAAVRAKNTLVRAYSYFGGEAKANNLDRRGTLVRVETTQATYHEDPYQQIGVQIIRFIENYRLHIFWLVLYTLLIWGIFIERSYFYAVEREHGGLRRIAGYGVTITRGAASVIMFTYSTILLTSCRNVITLLRETFLHKYIPFDSAINFHKYIGMWALFFSLVHTVGHAFNFYHIATQPADDLNCLFRDYYHATDELPKFHYWCFQTITGLTGVLLVMVGAIIYIFAIDYSRHHVFKVFWFTHNLYPVFYILMFLHGIGLIVQPPFFYYFFLGPMIVFILDRLVSVSRKKVEISVIRSEMLPSDVTMLLLKRPPNFEYKSGQWVRIACPILNNSEYHPFTLSSAPHEETISLHIRAVGPWTQNLRNTYNPANIRQHAYPKIYLDGPFGDAHEDWFRYEVAVLIGGGIGVTPFTSILKDVAYRANLGAKVPCKKVYFLWVTRTQKHFEWVTDIIRDVEDKDHSNLVVVHLFITQFYQKFDLRTTMLYICERHFQKISNRSLFTGLRSVTHFGRPNFKVFMDSLQLEYPGVPKFGIFSCGPPPMTGNVQAACDELNKREGAIFVHHYENF